MTQNFDVVLYFSVSVRTEKGLLSAAFIIGGVR